MSIQSGGSFNSQKGGAHLGTILIVFLVIILVLAIVRSKRREVVGDALQKRGFFERIFDRSGTPSSPILPGGTDVGSVPAEFQTLYSKLESKLNSFESKLDKEWDGSKSRTIFSAGLVTANPNSGDALLSSQAYDLTIEYLDSLEDLGVGGIGMDINFPLLDPNFRGPEKSQEYLNFYKKLVGEIKSRDIALTIEVQPIFPDFSNLPVKQYYQGLTIETYKQRVAEMLKVIAVELRPEYLTVANEPSTAAGNTGLPLHQLEVAVDEVKFILAELKKLGLSDVKYGAGFGNWQTDYQVWTQRYTELADLDFLNVHIYPADGDLLDRVLTIDDISQKNGKRLAIHETWLYKWQLGERSGDIAASANVFARDAYSFWQPLDSKFLNVLFKLAHSRNLEYVSPFWSNFFFTYFDYNQVKDMSGRAMMKEAILQGAQAAKEGKITKTGEAYKDLIK